MIFSSVLNSRMANGLVVNRILGAGSGEGVKCDIPGLVYNRISMDTGVTFAIHFSSDQGGQFVTSRIDSIDAISKPITVEFTIHGRISTSSGDNQGLCNDLPGSKFVLEGDCRPGFQDSFPVTYTSPNNHGTWLVKFFRCDVTEGPGGQPPCITGTDKNNNLIGTSGNDCLDGGKGNDRIAGLAGNDKLFGGDGNDILSGGKGNDDLIGGKGKDILKCGEGFDSVEDDPNDKVDRDCEIVSFPLPP